KGEVIVVEPPADGGVGQTGYDHGAWAVADLLVANLARAGGDGDGRFAVGGRGGHAGAGNTACGGVAHRVGPHAGGPPPAGRWQPGPDGDPPARRRARSADGER